MTTKNLGRVGFVMKGAFSSTATYKKLDVVTSDDGVYCAITQVAAGSSLSDTSKWMKMLESTGDVETDKTLAVEDKAADSKTVGDAIGFATTLTTTAQTDREAINELDEDIGDIDTAIAGADATVKDVATAIGTMTNMGAAAKSVADTIGNLDERKSFDGDAVAAMTETDGLKDAKTVKDILNLKIGSTDYKEADEFKLFQIQETSDGSEIYHAVLTELNDDMKFGNALDTTEHETKGEHEVADAQAVAIELQAMNAVAGLDVVDAASTIDGMELKDDGTQVANADANIKVYTVTEGANIYIHAVLDTQAVYQFEKQNADGTTWDLVGTTVAADTNAVVTVPANATRLLVSQLKTNEENSVRTTCIASYSEAVAYIG